MKKHNIILTSFMIGALFTGVYGNPSYSEDSTAPSPASSDDQQFFKDLDDRYSYAYGAELAKQFEKEGVQLNVEMLATAMRDVFGNGEIKMPDGEITATIGIYQEIHAKKKEAERAAIGEINKRASCLLYTSPSPRDQRGSRMPSSA